MMKYKCIIFDIDGVILDTSSILKDIYNKDLKGDEKWDYFYSNCNSSKVKVIKGIKSYTEFVVTNGILPILSTARNERVREETENKLKEEGVPFFKIYMRKEGDFRPSADVKREHLKEIMKNYSIILFIDDEGSNISMAEELGIPALKIPRSLTRRGDRNENTSN